MLTHIEVTADQRGAILELMGETACLATPTEIDLAVVRIREKLEAAAEDAKEQLRVTRSNGPYSASQPGI